MLLEYGMVAQLAERKIEALGVGSSILSHSTSSYYFNIIKYTLLADMFISSR